MYIYIYVVHVSRVCLGGRISRTKTTRPPPWASRRSQTARNTSVLTALPKNKLFLERAVEIVQDKYLRIRFSSENKNILLMLVIRERMFNALKKYVMQ